MKIMLIALGFATLAGGASAQPVALEDPPSAAVVFSDLNLSEPDERKILHLRVRHAIDALCRAMTGTSPHYYAQASCRRDAWREARLQIDRARSRAQADASIAAPGDGAIMTVSIRK